MSTQKERGIIFKAEMVRAILDGRKTMTRRVIKPQPGPDIDRLHGGDLRGRFPYPLMDDNEDPCGFGFQDEAGNFWRCPYGQPGDRLWVRETHWINKSEGLVAYRTDGEMPKHMSGERWRPSIFMPRWASRITLEVTGVRVERLQEITMDDVHREGVACSDCWSTGSPYQNFPHPEYCGCKNLFVNLWDSLNAKRGFGWEVNPFVWVVEFKKL